MSEQFRRYLDLENAARILNQLAEGLGAAARMIASHFPMNLLGVEAVHRGRVQLGLGRLYFVIYRDGLGEVSYRTVTVLVQVKGMFGVFCHLNQEIRRFVRSRIVYAEPL